MMMAFGSKGYIHAVEPTDTLQFVYKLHGQTRKFQYVFTPEKDGGVTLHWGIERNLKWWQGSYKMSAEAVDQGNALSYLMPEDGNNVSLANQETFAMISRDAYRQLKSLGRFTYDGVEYEKQATEQSPIWGTIIQVCDSEGAHLQILDNPQLPLIVNMRNNPLEIDWTVMKRNLNQ